MLRRCRPLLGTFVEVTSDREAGIEAAFSTMSRVHRLMSAHEPHSDVSRINRLGHLSPVKIHDWTARVLERALFWSRASAGAFDVVRAGKTALEREYLPRHVDQPPPRAAHWTWLELEWTMVRLLAPGCVDLGGIAKGFAVDRATEAMQAAGATAGLVNAGGDMACFGEQTWPVAIAHPITRQPAIEVRLRGETLATSAVHSAEERRLTSSHLVDCDGGLISASVRGQNCIDADALTKIVLSGSAKAARCLAIAGAQALIIDRDGRVEAVQPEAAAA